MLGINSNIPNQLIPKINSIYNAFQSSSNPQLSYINLISIGILSLIINNLNLTNNQSHTKMNGYSALLAAISSDIAIDILNIQTNGYNNCNITSQILTFDNSICKLSQAPISCPTPISCPVPISCPAPISYFTFLTNEIKLYLFIGFCIFLFIILIILYLNRK